MSVMCEGVMCEGVMCECAMCEGVMWECVSVLPHDARQSTWQVACGSSSLNN